jgi:hypothetical protein
MNAIFRQLHKCRHAKVSFYLLDLKCHFTLRINRNFTYWAYFLTLSTDYELLFTSFTKCKIQVEVFWIVTPCRFLGVYQRLRTWRQHDRLKYWYPTTILQVAKNTEDLDLKYHNRETLKTRKCEGLFTQGPNWKFLLYFTQSDAYFLQYYPSVSKLT